MSLKTTIRRSRIKLKQSKPIPHLSTHITTAVKRIPPTGDYLKAIADYTRTIELSPDDYEALNNRGIAFRGLGEPDRALEDFNAAIMLNPDYPKAYYNRDTYRNRSRDREALADFIKVRELSATDFPDINQEISTIESSISAETR